ncbi:MAG: hypothetical protein MUP82_06510 [Candidatus Marinimicrobia bacterium]|nr:hypothetical protein [Candidatus Neomarinimicrobiota bacterium]
MTDVSNLFSNFNDLTKKSVTDLSTDYNSTKNERPTTTPGLKQGKKFKKFQQGIETRLEGDIQNVNSKEGFQGRLTRENKTMIRENDYSSQQGSIDNLRQEYQDTLTKYENLVAQISGSTSGYLDRVNPNNPYLNKTIKFTTGEIAYVTNQGIVKYVPSDDILKSTSIPQTAIPVNIPWDNAYSAPGATIPTTPSLISGTPLQRGQSVGNEGVNVFVNKLINNPTASYKGCYADNIRNPTMKFIGGAPSLPNLIQNGSFSQPTIRSNSYQYLSWNARLVPGWNFNCVLLNKSTAWGYPIPYPNGDQCACIQMNQQLWTNIWMNLSPGVTYTLSFSACGRNGTANPINIGVEGKTFYTLNAEVGRWKTYSTTFTVEKSGGQRLSFIGNWTSSDRSTAIQNIVLSSGTPRKGTYTYDDCKSAAIDSGYQYFALQDVDNATSKGFCAVSDSEPSATRPGISVVPNKMTALWSSNTQGQTGNSAILTISGSLSVINSGSASVFSTPSTNANPPNFIGCYGDRPQRAIPLLNNNGSFSSWFGGNTWNNTVSSAEEYARANNFKYFGIQAANTSNGQGQGGFTNDLARATKYGKASNCNKVSGSSIDVGGGWSNAIYSADGVSSNYFLILQDDGNMCVYRGTGPNDNQGNIWCSSTNGRQQSANPQYAAAKGKYGKNWISQGTTLAAGDFVGSNNGNMALIMQSDGNLVLYTFTMESNCSQMADGKTGGGVNANALYKLDNTGQPSVMTQVAFIDPDSELHQYSADNIQYSNTYTKMSGTNSAGADIPRAAYGNTNVAACQATCDSKTNCAGFVFARNTCYPKTDRMYPNKARTSDPQADLYIRSKTPISPPIGISNTTNNVDSVSYYNYIKGGSADDSYGLSKATSSQQQLLSQLETQLNQLTAQIANLTGRFGEGSLQAEQQIQINERKVGEYLEELNSNNTNITNFSTNIENIVNDSDIVVLQKNYDYLFWSILATGTVIVAMNTMES